MFCEKKKCVFVILCNNIDFIYVHTKKKVDILFRYFYQKKNTEKCEISTFIIILKNNIKTILRIGKIFFIFPFVNM